MGEAKRRGTYEERKATAIERNKKIAKHYKLDFKALTLKQIGRMNNAWAKLTRAQKAEVTSGEEKE